MLALAGRSATCLNSADSAKLLAVPCSIVGLADVRHAAVDAVDCRGLPALGVGSVSPATEEPTFIDSSAISLSDSAGSPERSNPSAHGELDDNDMFRLLLFPEIDLGSYYMSRRRANTNGSS
jgi:hypothetical protein